MYTLSRLLAAWVSARTVSTRVMLLQWLLGGLAAIAIFIMLAMTLTGILLLEGFYCLYQYLMVMGMTSQLAAAVVAGFIFLLILLFVALAWIQWLRTSALPRRILTTGNLMHGQIHNVIEAFVSGYNRQS